MCDWGWCWHTPYELETPCQKLTVTLLNHRAKFALNCRTEQNKIPSCMLAQALRQNCKIRQTCADNSRPKCVMPRQYCRSADMYLDSSFLKNGNCIIGLKPGQTFSYSCHVAALHRSIWSPEWKQHPRVVFDTALNLTYTTSQMTYLCMFVWIASWAGKVLGLPMRWCFQEWKIVPSSIRMATEQAGACLWNLHTWAASKSVTVCKQGILGRCVTVWTLQAFPTTLTKTWPTGHKSWVTSKSIKDFRVCDNLPDLYVFSKTELHRWGSYEWIKSIQITCAILF